MSSNHQNVLVGSNLFDAISKPKARNQKSEKPKKKSHHYTLINHKVARLISSLKPFSA